MKKTLVALAAIALIITTTFALVSCLGNASIYNSGFEETNEAGTILEWEKIEDSGSATRTMTHSTIPESSDESKNGIVNGKYVRFEVSNARGSLGLKQKVSLKKNVVYELTYSINVLSSISTASEAFGAYIGFEEDLLFKEVNHKSKTTGWIRNTVYFRAENGGDFHLMLGVGRNELGGATGKAEFDNITLKEAKDVPAGVTVGSLNGDNNSAKAGILAYVIIMLLITMIMLAAAYILHLRFKHNHEFGIKEKSRWVSPLMNFVYVMTGVFIVRFLVVALTSGMSSEMSELGNIAFRINDKGMTNLYATSNTTLPTGMLYWLSLVGAIGSAAGLNSLSLGTSILIRLPNVIADIVVCYLLFMIVAKYRSSEEGVAAAAIYGLVPTFFSLTSLWGASTSITIAFLIGMAYFMIEKKYIGVSGMYLGALMFNNYALIFAPVVILYDIFFLIKDKSLFARLSIPLSAVGAVLLIFLISLPFTVNQVAAGNVLMVFKKMYAEFATNVLVSNSAFGIYGSFGLGASVATTASKAITGIIMLIFLGLMAWAYTVKRNRLDLVLLLSLSAILYTVFGIGARIEVMVMGIVLLILYAFIREDRRVFGAMNVFTVLSFINIGVVLYSSNVFVKDNAYQPLAGNSWIYILGSLLTIVNVFYLVFVAYRILFKADIAYAEPAGSVKEYFERVGDGIKNTFRLNRK